MAMASVLSVAPEKRIGVDRILVYLKHCHPFIHSWLHCTVHVTGYSVDWLVLRARIDCMSTEDRSVALTQIAACSVNSRPFPGAPEPYSKSIRRVQSSEPAISSAPFRRCLATFPTSLHEAARPCLADAI